MVTKTKTQKTVAEIIYKGSYNVLCELSTTNKMELNVDITNNKKVMLQLSMFNSQKLFCKIDKSVKDETNFALFTLLTTPESKTNFARFLSIAKKVFEPKMVW